MTAIRLLPADPLERIAASFAFAAMRWVRRREAARRPEELARRVEAALAAEAREREWARLVSPPPR